jgi:hypothetical protein
MHIPRDSGSSLPVKNVKARFRYSPLRSETGMTVGFSSVYVGKTALVMPVIAPAKYRIPLCPAHPERIRLFIAREKRKSEIPVFSTLFRNRNDSGVLIGLRGKNSPCHAGYCASKIPLSRCALRIPRDSGSPLPVKSIKARFRYSPLRSETGMTKGLASRNPRI